MKLPLQNIFKEIPRELPTELFETLMLRDQVKLERIISRGHTTPDGEWYDQDCDEWVILLQGNAVLLFQDNSTISLGCGDYLMIPAHTLHRVEWTDPDRECVWLAIHILSEERG